MKAAVRELWGRLGGLSKPSKMPCHGWSISARLCIMGAILHAVPGTVCRFCYALRGRYVFANVQAALARRLAAYHREGPEEWARLMSSLILAVERSGFFRWFDSGDVQSVAMARAIRDVATRTPGVRHWIPTKERDLWRKALGDGIALPQNAVLRISAPYVGQAIAVPRWAVNVGAVTTSSVGLIDLGGIAASCRAPQQGGKCLECRLCWDGETFRVNYEQH